MVDTFAVFAKLKGSQENDAGPVADRTRNAELLAQRPWFDVPLVLSTGRRAIVAIEKGEAGEDAFRQAFAAWGPVENR